MKVAYLSDLHLDFISKNMHLSKLMKITKELLKNDDSEVLIIAGDSSHYNHQTIMFIELALKKYKKVFIVAGNHELYNVSKTQKYKYTDTYDKFNELKEKVNNIPKAEFLDGNIVEYKGVKFGGCMAWYDCSYYYKLSKGMYSETMLSHWNNYTNDSNLIPRLNDPMVLFEKEIKKVKSVLDEQPDIMITHICPVSDAIAFNKVYKLEKSSGYYCFDGLDLIDPIYNVKPPKFWIHGHMHDTNEFTIYKTTHLRNPVGYPGEKNDFILKSFEI